MLFQVSLCRLLWSSGRSYDYTRPSEDGLQVAIDRIGVA